jgi:ABC-2 type transport system permease protein
MAGPAAFVGDPAAAAPLRPRSIGAVNWRGLWTLYAKEVRRFLKVITQTVASPVVSTLLFLVVFSLALGRSAPTMAGVPFVQFIVPGLVMMAMAQNAFANTSSSLVIAKMQGNIVDVLMPPLSAAELTVAYALGGVTRGLVVGVVTVAAMWVAVPLRIHDLGAIAYYAVAASLMLSLLGLLAGVWAQKFDHIAAVTNFIVTPLTFLSGTFYSIERLPEAWVVVAHANPFFYMIDGFRYGFTGAADMSLWLGAAVLAVVDLALGLLVWRLFAIGYNLKA